MNEAFLIGADGHRHAMVRSAEPVTIGRTSENDCVVARPEVSRRHASITYSGGAWRLVDLASRNGTFVDGEPLGERAHLLADGDEIVLAGVSRFEFRDPMATPAAPRVGRLQGVWIDPDTDAVWVDSIRVEPPISARQFALLSLLEDNLGDIVSRRQIVDVVWRDVAAEGVTDDAVAALVKRLRARLRENPTGREWVEVVRGRGVRLLNA